MILFKLIYKLLKKVIEKAGFNIAMSRKYRTNNNYESILPIASYAPWISDKSFNKTYTLIEKYTLVDKYRCYELWQ